MTPTLPCLASLTLLVLTGCTSVDLDEHMAPGAHSWLVDSGHSNLVAGRNGADFAGLHAVEAQLFGPKSSHNMVVGRGADPVPTPLARSSAFRSIVRFLLDSSRRPASEQSVSLSAGELEGLTEALLDTVDLLDGDAANARVKSMGLNAEAESERALSKVISQYLLLYFNGKFVDRGGAGIAKPELSNNIGTDTISALVTVLLEATCDYFYKTPVFHDGTTAEFAKEYVKDGGPQGLYVLRYKNKGEKMKFVTKEGKRPTASATRTVQDEALVGSSSLPGITKEENRVMVFLSGLAGEKAKLGSGLVLRSFGDLELSFVIGGHFSVGDNDTLAKVVETTFEVLARRSTEALAYRFFTKFTPNADAAVQADGMPQHLKDLLQGIAAEDAVFDPEE